MKEDIYLLMYLAKKNYFGRPINTHTHCDAAQIGLGRTLSAVSRRYAEAAKHATLQFHRCSEHSTRKMTESTYEHINVYELVCSSRLQDNHGVIQ